MLHPSYSDLIEVANSGVEEGEHPVVNSRYSIVIATAKRARQIIAGAEPLIDNARGKKPLSIAVEELYKGKVKILGEDEEMNEEIVAEADDADEEAIEETVE
ncbi:DNA-directed RNA polymerase subunit omega [Frisingicoccus sp.]|uniref:DNA-directed RNA polymerase subunit omega n=1 Tax=Frisingicoccus sp. TaxID=1918627 RepID=UPI002ECCD861|nr:DNA-directed RNA polymerase subunit omega [Frisingicoccus sp.]